MSPPMWAAGGRPRWRVAATTPLRAPGVPQAQGDHQVGLLLDLVLVNIVVKGVPAARGEHTAEVGGVRHGDGPDSSVALACRHWCARVKAQCRLPVEPIVQRKSTQAAAQQQGCSQERHHGIRVCGAGQGTSEGRVLKKVRIVLTRRLTCLPNFGLLAAVASYFSELGACTRLSKQALGEGFGARGTCRCRPSKTPQVLQRGGPLRMVFICTA